MENAYDHRKHVLIKKLLYHFVMFKAIDIIWPWSSGYTLELHIIIFCGTKHEPVDCLNS